VTMMRAMRASGDVALGQRFWCWHIVTISSTLCLLIDELILRPLDTAMSGTRLARPGPHFQMIGVLMPTPEVSWIAPMRPV
jgi:hypothetical protein